MSRLKNESRTKIFDLFKAGITLDDIKKFHQEYHSHYCDYEEPWAGKCGRNKNKESLAFISVKYLDTEYWLCEKHAKEKCRTCGRPATKGCSHAGQFVCGSPQCPEHNCKH